VVIAVAIFSVIVLLIAEPNRIILVGCSSVSATVTADIAGLAEGTYYCDIDIYDLYSAEFARAVPVILSVVTYGDRAGTSEDPYLIYAPQHLNAIDLNPTSWERHFRLMAGIDLSAYSGTEFNIIGNGAIPFASVFDGNSHEVSSFAYSCSGKTISAFLVRLMTRMLKSGASVSSLRTSAHPHR
jgi:hypothetical protein